MTGHEFLSYTCSERLTPHLSPVLSILSSAKRLSNLGTVANELQQAQEGTATAQENTCICSSHTPCTIKKL